MNGGGQAQVGHRKIAQLTGSIWTGVVIAFLASSGYAAWRWFGLEDGDITRSIVVGRINAPGPVTHGIAVMPGAGYDGQFYYRFALDPFQLNGLVNGIHVDSPIRLQRIGYPFLAWVLSGGSASAVPYVLVLVNVASFAAIAAVGGLLARSYGHSPLWGLAFCAYSGFVVTLSRDLTELLCSALVLGALLALRQNKPVLAGTVLTLAVLTRETAMILVAALVVTRVVTTVRRREVRPTRADSAWLLPLAGYVVWQTFLLARYHHLAALSERDNGSVPGAAPAAAVSRWLQHVDSGTLIFLFASCSLLILVGLVVSTIRRTSSLAMTALTLSVLLAISLSRSVWNDDAAEIRTLADIHLYGVVALLQSSPGRLWLYLATATPPLVLAGAYYVTNI